MDALQGSSRPQLQQASSAQSPGSWFDWKHRGHTELALHPGDCAAGQIPKFLHCTFGSELLVFWRKPLDKVAKRFTSSEKTPTVQFR